MFKNKQHTFLRICLGIYKTWTGLDWTGLDNWTGQLNWTIGLDFELDFFYLIDAI